MNTRLHTVASLLCVTIALLTSTTKIHAGNDAIFSYSCDHLQLPFQTTTSV